MNSFERKPSSNQAVTLVADRLRVQLSPSVGGAISAFEWTAHGKSRPVLRDCHGRLGTVLDASSFPMVPYVNRIRGGSFQFRGRDVSLKPNMSGDPSPLHGQGWLSRWQVESASEQKAVLTYHHEAGEWPWSYAARQEFTLEEGGLTITLMCRNLGDDPMPCGLGQHPYFPCGPKTLIDTKVTHVWTVDEQVLPIARVPAEGRYDLKQRLICGQGLDNGFAGWSGEAFMSDPDWPFKLRLTSPSATFFQIYSPAAGGIFVAEPVTHANAALNAPEEQWPGLGMKVLQPRAAMSMSLRLEVISR